jgi:hypothetical protein
MFNQFQGTLEKGVVQLFAEVSFASGVATMVISTVNGGCKGLASVTNTGTGVYDIVLQDSYVRLLCQTASWKNLSGSCPAVRTVSVSVDSVTDATTPKVTLKMFNAAGSVVSPADTDVMHLCLNLSNSTAL